MIITLTFLALYKPWATCIPRSGLHCLLHCEQLNCANQMKLLTTTLLTQCWWPPGRAICDSHVSLTFSALFHWWREHKRLFFFFFFCHSERSGVISGEGFSGVICVCVYVWVLSVGCSSYSKWGKRPECYILLTFQTSQHRSRINVLLRRAIVLFLEFRPDEKGKTNNTWYGLPSTCVYSVT